MKKKHARWGRPERWEEMRREISAMKVDETIIMECDEEDLITCQSSAGMHFKRAHPERVYRTCSALGKLYIVRAK